MLSFFLGRSRTCPMLALTTYPGPRNLLIDLAFFGLSTMTSERPRAPSSPEAGRLAADFDFDFDCEADEEAGRFRVLASGGASGLDDALADLRATGSPYPLARRPLRAPCRAGATVRDRQTGRRFAFALGTIPGTLLAWAG